MPLAEIDVLACVADELESLGYIVEVRTNGDTTRGVATLSHQIGSMPFDLAICLAEEFKHRGYDVYVYQLTLMEKWLIVNGCTIGINMAGDSVIVAGHYLPLSDPKLFDYIEQFIQRSIDGGRSWTNHGGSVYDLGTTQRNG